MISQNAGSRPVSLVSLQLRARVGITGWFAQAGNGSMLMAPRKILRTGSVRRIVLTGMTGGSWASYLRIGGSSPMSVATDR